MAMSAGQDDGEPIMSLNTTPLIDVMLVLLVMFIITIPIQTHAVKIDLPVNNPFPPPIIIKPTFNNLNTTPDGQILWNGSPIDLITLATYLQQSKAIQPVPELHIKPDPQTRYSVIDEMLAVVKRSKVDKVGFVGNDVYGVFGK